VRVLRRGDLSVQLGGIYWGLGEFNVDLLVNGVTCGLGT
jgi:hypothetical protein